MHQRMWPALVTEIYQFVVIIITLLMRAYYAKPFLKWFDLTATYPRFVYNLYDSPIPLSGVRVNLSPAVIH